MKSLHCNQASGESEHNVKVLSASEVTGNGKNAQGQSWERSRSLSRMRKQVKFLREVKFIPISKVRIIYYLFFFYISTSDQMETSLFGAVEHGLPCLFIWLSLVRVMRQEMIFQLLIFKPNSWVINGSLFHYLLFETSQKQCLRKNLEKDRGFTGWMRHLLSGFDCPPFPHCSSTKNLAGG